MYIVYILYILYPSLLSAFLVSPWFSGGEALKEVPLSDSEEEKVVEDGYGVAKDAAEGDKGDLGFEIHLDTDPYSLYIQYPFSIQIHLEKIIFSSTVALFIKNSERTEQ